MLNSLLLSPCIVPCGCILAAPGGGCTGAGGGIVRAYIITVLSGINGHVFATFLDVGVPRERRAELFFTQLRKLQQGLIGIASEPKHGGKSRFGFASL
jgi:hypothetical protein